MSDWKEYRLGDIISIKSGLPYKGEYLNKGDNYLLGMGCVSFAETFLPNGARRYSDGGKPQYIGKAGDIVLATRQQSDNMPILGMPAIIPDFFEEGKVIIGSNLYMVDNKSDVDNRFLFWLLRTPQYINHIRYSQTGTTVRMITKKDIENFTFHCPPKNQRNTISSLLWNIQDKIETNRKINIRLEELAQALFKSWFIDFEPFGGKMPEDWEEGKLGDICKCVLGGTPNRANPEFWGGDIPWINSGEVNKFRILEPSEYITELGLEKSATKLLPKGTVVLAITGATLGQVSLLEIDTCANQSVVGILETLEMPFTYLYPFINSAIAELLKLQTGGAQQHINKQNVESMTIRIPSKEVLTRYDSIERPIYNRIACICFESARLAILRDTLLPKLMSGELIPE